MQELDEGGGAHVPVHGAGDNHVVVVIGHTVDRSLQSGQRRGARGVRSEIGPAQVEHRRHPAGCDVGQLARHGVFGGVGNAGPPIPATAPTRPRARPEAANGRPACRRWREHTRA